MTNMSEKFNKSLEAILKWEGGFVNHPKDPGGITNMGITKKVYENYTTKKVTEQDMRELTHADVIPIYKEKYWNPLRAEYLPEGLALCVFDFGVNAGVNRSSRYLQEMVGATVDGIVGPKTIKTANDYYKKHGKNYTILLFQEMRRNYYKQLHHFDTFGKGWLNRVNDIEKIALGS